MQKEDSRNKEALTVKRTGQRDDFFQTVKEIYAYKEMIISFVRRELRGRYKGSALGFFWTFLNPLLQLCVYSIVFSTILKQGIEKYYLFLFVALIPWIFFSSSVTGSASSVIAQKDMVKKIYFPREVLPIAHVTTNFVNMLLCFIVIFAVVVISGTKLDAVAVLCLVPVWIVEYILALGMAFIASSVTVYFRDMEHILGILMLAWQYLTPVLYGYDIIPDQYKLWFSLNPMTPVIGAYRTILYEARVPELETLLWALALGLTVLMVGWCTFTRLKRRFAEEL
ncbi:MAG: ABC transporter permease [Ruminococcaceae bacterium]|nr:ABC transporter permease [Oscillospiraceae bacterium]